MKYVLTCDCGSTDFVYDNEVFRCRECNNIYTAEDAGENLLGDFEN